MLMRMIRLGQGLLALASAGVAVVTVTCGDFALLGKSLPAGLPGREIWVSGFALAVLVASGGLCFARTARVSALTIGVYCAAWAVTCTPQIYANPISIGGWYGFCEALTSLTGAWIPHTLSKGKPIRRPHPFRLCAPSVPPGDQE